MQQVLRDQISPSLSRGFFAVSPKGVEIPAQPPRAQNQNLHRPDRTRSSHCVSVWSTITPIEAFAKK